MSVDLSLPVCSVTVTEVVRITASWSLHTFGVLRPIDRLRVGVVAVPNGTATAPGSRACEICVCVTSHRMLRAVTHDLLSG